jgi:hypothetical protein
MTGQKAFILEERCAASRLEGIALSAAAVLWSFGVLAPLSDTAILRADRAGTLHYVEVRAAGSATFLLTNIVAGFVITRTDYGAGVVIMAAAGAIYALVAAMGALGGAAL